MTLSNFDHVNVRTANLDGLLHFYCEVLGLEKGPRPAFRFDGAWLRCGGRASLHLREVPSQPNTGEPRIEHFAFWATASMVGPIAVEQFATGLGAVVFVAYLSHLCGNRAYTATQYALLSSFAAQARVSLAAPSGFVAAYAGWIWYYIFGTLLAVPGLVLLWWLCRREPVEKAADAR